jgi:hypothetical protein
MSKNNDEESPHVHFGSSRDIFHKLDIFEEFRIKAS